MTTLRRQLRAASHDLKRSAVAAIISDRDARVLFVLSKSDYGNTTITGIPTYFLRRLQFMLNAAARLIAGLPRSAHISTTLSNLHWLHDVLHVTITIHLYLRIN